MFVTIVTLRSCSVELPLLHIATVQMTTREIYNVLVKI